MAKTQGLRDQRRAAGLAKLSISGAQTVRCH